jgi:hypothetical protein
MAALLVLVAVAPVQATPIHIDAQASYITPDPPLGSVIPANTPVTGSFDVSIPSGLAASFLPFPRALPLAHGAFTWNNGGPQVFNVSSATIASINGSGLMNLVLGGSGPTLNGFLVQQFMLNINLPTASFPTVDLADIIMDSGVVGAIRVRLMGETGFTDHTLIQNVSGDIYETDFVVPEPSSIALAGVGCFAMLAFGWKRRRRTAA